MRIDGKTLFALGLTAMSLTAFANGNPVMRFSSINRVSNPEPLSLPEIRLISEKLRVTHIDGYNCFEVSYIFQNECDKDFPEIDYGFPIDYLISDDQEAYHGRSESFSESSYEVGWNGKLIKDVRFTLNTTDLPFKCAKESLREVSFVPNEFEEDEIELIEGINRRWFYTQFSVKSHEEVTLNVSYKVLANSVTSASDYFKDFAKYTRRDVSEEFGWYNLSFLNRYCPEFFHIIYDFSPAKHFGNGVPFNLDVEVSLTNFEDPVIRAGNYFWYSNKVERINNYIKAEEVDPLDLTVYLSHSSIEKLINQAIDKFGVSETEFNVSTYGDSIQIDFHKPIFVSDLVCDMDTTGVNQIDAVVAYADGRQKQYRFERVLSKKNIQLMPNEIPSILTITDIYDEMSLNNSSEDDSRIKKINLFFDSASDSAIRGIKVVDARFIK